MSAFSAFIREPLAQCFRQIAHITQPLGLGQFYRDTADYIDGTVGGVEKKLVDRWGAAAMSGVGLVYKTENGNHLSAHGKNKLIDNLRQMAEEVRVNRANGMTRTEAQETVISKIESSNQLQNPYARSL